MLFCSIKLSVETNDSEPVYVSVIGVSTPTLQDFFQQYFDSDLDSRIHVA